MSFTWPPETCWLCEDEKASTLDGVCRGCDLEFKYHIDPEGNDVDYGGSGVFLARAALHLVANHVRMAREFKEFMQNRKAKA